MMSCWQPVVERPKVKTMEQFKMDMLFGTLLRLDKKYKKGVAPGNLGVAKYSRFEERLNEIREEQSMKWRQESFDVVELDEKERQLGIILRTRIMKETSEDKWEILSLKEVERNETWNLQVTSQFEKR
jgi:hypothetical protein